jgi:hypothetical protein
MKKETEFWIAYANDNMKSAEMLKQGTGAYG